MRKKFLFLLHTSCINADTSTIATTRVQFRARPTMAAGKYKLFAMS